MDVPHLKITIKEDEIIEGANNLLPILRPDWDLKLVRFKIFTDGITNKLLGCFNGSQNNDAMLIRVYGNKTDLFVDRKAETRNFKLLHAAGLAPRLYCTFEGGLVYEYVEGDILTVGTCYVENISILVAQTLADMHCIRTEDDAFKKPILWGKMRQFLNLVPVKFSSSIKEARYKELFKENLNLEEEFSFLQENLSMLDSPIVFCHNDLLLGNIIYNREKDFITFIDYEYAGHNYQAYDIANHFNEYAGVEAVDYSLFPGYEYQIRWLRNYLERYYCNISKGSRKNSADCKIVRKDGIYIFQIISENGNLARNSERSEESQPAEYSDVTNTFFSCLRRLILFTGLGLAHFKRAFDNKKWGKELVTPLVPAPRGCVQNSDSISLSLFTNDNYCKFVSSPVLRLIYGRRATVKCNFNAFVGQMESAES